MYLEFWHLKQVSFFKLVKTLIQQCWLLLRKDKPDVLSIIIGNFSPVAIVIICTHGGDRTFLNRQGRVSLRDSVSMRRKNTDTK